MAVEITETEENHNMNKQKSKKVCMKNIYQETG